MSNPGTTWNVTLYNNGRRLDVIIEAASQREALKFGEFRAPGYKACNAQRA